MRNKKISNELVIICSGIAFAVLFYSIGALRCQTLNMFRWGWHAITLVCFSWILSVLGVLALTILTRLSAIAVALLIGIFVISGFWGMIFHFLLPRIMLGHGL